jgi:hypothetical protein
MMNKRARTLSAVCALIIGLTLALPIRASADEKDHGDHGRHHQRQAWRWERDKNHYRAYPYTLPPEYGYNYWQRQQYLPENGQGMVNPRNPNVYWACDSEGHHCHWAPRYRTRRY